MEATMSRQAQLDAINAFCSQPFPTRVQQAREFIPAASKIAEAMGPLFQAGDHSAAALGCALVNATLILDGWCSCQDHSSANDCYYCYTNGSHGWICSSCCRRTQVG